EWVAARTNGPQEGRCHLSLQDLGLLAAANRSRGLARLTIRRSRVEGRLRQGVNPTPWAAQRQLTCGAGRKGTARNWYRFRPALDCFPPRARLKHQLSEVQAASQAFAHRLRTPQLLIPQVFRPALPIPSRRLAPAG